MARLPSAYALGGLAILLAILQSFTEAAVDWEWRKGRATHYGGSGDPWTIHYGSCGYYYLDPTVNKGWDVAALPDAVHDFAGSCGRCYEVACDPSYISDGYGTQMDRTGVCYDPDTSVTVMITDSCPCNYPPNFYSNKRWCCADYYHFDLSYWTYEKLADKKWGVIGIKYREVPCDHCPEKPATPPGGQPAAAVQSPPSGWQPSSDKRPFGQMCFKSSTEYQDGTAGYSSADASSSSSSSVSSASGSISSSSSSSTSSAGSISSSSSATSSSSSSTSGSSGVSSSISSSSSSSSSMGSLFESNTFLNGWQDWSYKLGGSWQGQGPDGTNAWCGTVQAGGAVQFKGGNGNFGGKKQLKFEVKVDSTGQLPDFTLTLSSSQKGDCRSIGLRGLSGGRNGDWSSLTIPLINLSWATSSWTSNPSDFSGCSSSIGYWDVDIIVFRNKWNSDQQFCVASVEAW